MNGNCLWLLGKGSYRVSEADDIDEILLILLNNVDIILHNDLQTKFIELFSGPSRSDSC